MLGNLTEINSELALADALLFPFAFDIAENLLIIMKLLALDIFNGFQNLGLDIKLYCILHLYSSTGVSMSLLPNKCTLHDNVTDHIRKETRPHCGSLESSFSFPVTCDK